MRHEFTKIIIDTIESHFKGKGEEIFKKSELIQYLNFKMKSANSGSKARGGFGNIYAVFTLTEDYIKKGFFLKSGYDEYEGAQFKDLFRRQRELPFGSKLQNHALNQRMNQEFKKLFPVCDYTPIIRVVETKRYWINRKLLELDKQTNIAHAVIDIVNLYINSKKSAFESFIATCEKLKLAKDKDLKESKSFIISLLEPNIDARIFEIVSFSILKYYYNEQTVFFGETLEKVEEENLMLFKTGRTNANDGGIDFVMKPLGRFFQVTETTDVKKYFLDIDKLEKFPITFVIKSLLSVDDLFSMIKKGAKEQFSITAVVNKYVNCIEEIINIDLLLEFLEEIHINDDIDKVINEIIIQSKVEFNYQED